MSKPARQPSAARPAWAADGLKEVQRRRLELGDTLRGLLHIAHERGDEETVGRIRQLLVRLAEDRFRLAVVGQFSRGKSTLMNAILGAGYLPTGVLPMTSVVTTVRYSSRPRAMVRRRESDLAVEAPLEELARFVSQSSVERAELQVATVDIEVPAEVLRLGFAFVDTPGVGSAIEVNTATTRRFLPQADAVIFVTAFDSPLTGAEVEFLAEVRRHVGKLFLVVNKRDLVSDRDAAEIIEFVHRRLRDDLHLDEPRVFALSALEALRARVRNDHASLTASGLPPFSDALVEFLTTQKAKVFLGNLVARTSRLVTRQRRDLRLGRLAEDGGPDVEAIAAAFERRLGSLRDRQRATLGRLADRAATTLPGLLAPRGPAWQADLRKLMVPCLDQAISERSAQDSGLQAVKAAGVGLERAGRPVAEGWLHRRAAEVHELLIGLVTGEIANCSRWPAPPGRWAPSSPGWRWPQTTPTRTAGPWRTSPPWACR